MENTSSNTFLKQFVKWWKRNYVWVVMAIVAVAILAAGFLFLIYPPQWLIAPEKQGTIGDYFNGLMGPFIALIAAIGTFAAFLVQYQANQAQKAALKEQSIQFLHDRFEQRFMEMIKMHRENVGKITYVMDHQSNKFYSGQNSIECIALEMEVSFYRVSKLTCNFHSPRTPHQDFRDAVQLTYHSFKAIKINQDFGVGLSEKLAPKDYLHFLAMMNGNAICSIGNHDQHDGFWLNRIFAEIRASLEELYPRVSASQGPFYERMVPWRGQHQTLSPYLRHLNLIYQMLDEAAFSTGAILTPDQTRFYADFLRSQLTLEEQKLLFYLSLTEVLSHWWTQNWMSRYNPIADLQQENLPAGLELEALKNQMQPN